MTPFYICIVSRANQKEIILQCNYLHQDGDTPEHNSSQHWDSFLTFMNGQSTWESDRNSVSKTMLKGTNRSYPQLTDTISIHCPKAKGRRSQGVEVSSSLSWTSLRVSPVLPAAQGLKSSWVTASKCYWNMSMERHIETLDLLLHPCKHTYPRGKKSS